MTKIACAQCGGDLGGYENRKGFLCYLVGGDEETQSWFFCGACQLWTVEEYCDSFMGTDSCGTRGPISKEAGDRAVAELKECPTPSDKWCECPVHRKHSG